jgi:septum formation protein
MLAAAGVEFSTKPSSVDESALKLGVSNAEQLATELAKAKALDVGDSADRDWIIGSDSVVDVDGRLFDKPRSRDEAAEHLRFFSGRTIMLTSAVALVHGKAARWAHVETARLKVRTLSYYFIESYLEAEWPEVGYCVGVFRMEGRGVQLFESIAGDHFTILGMPLLPLLAALRERGLIPA